MSYIDQTMTLVRAGVDLTLRQIAVLGMAHARKADPDARQVKRLAADLGVQKPIMTRAFDALEKAGLARRGQIVGDRRSAIIILTPKGEKLAAGLMG